MNANAKIATGLLAAALAGSGVTVALNDTPASENFAGSLCLTAQRDLGRSPEEAEALCSHPDPRLVQRVEQSIRSVQNTPSTAQEEAETLRRLARLHAERARQEALDEKVRAAKAAGLPVPKLDAVSARPFDPGAPPAVAEPTVKEPVSR